MVFLFSKGVRRILLYFIMNPEKEHHLRELASRLSLDPGNLSRDMKKLADMGLMTVSEKGRLKSFALNKRHPLYKEIRGLILKTEGASTLLKKALEPLKGIRRAFLYGSFAAASEDAASDIDLMVVGDIQTLELIRAIRPLERSLGREIHYRILEPGEFRKQLKKKDVFLTDVMNGPTIPIVERA